MNKKITVGLLSVFMIVSFWVGWNHFFSDENKGSTDSAKLSDAALSESSEDGGTQAGATDAVASTEALDDAERKEPLPIFLSPVATPIGMHIASFLEEKGVGYLDTSVYPPSEEVAAQVYEYFKEGKFLVFDNTADDLWNALKESHGDGLTSSRVIADLTNGIAAGDPEVGSLVVASAIQEPGIEDDLHYLMIEVPLQETPEATQALLESELAFLQGEQATMIEEQALGITREGQVVQQEITPIESGEDPVNSDETDSVLTQDQIDAYETREQSSEETYDDVTEPEEVAPEKFDGGELEAEEEEVNGLDA